MGDDDMIRRGSVLERLDLAEHDAEERDWRSGANEIARLRKYVAAIPAADARAEALKEAAAVAAKFDSDGMYGAAAMESAMGDILPCPFCGVQMEDFHGHSFAHPLGENRDDACILSGLSFSYTHSRWGTDERPRWNRRAIPAATRPVQDDAASRRRKIMGHMDDRAAADARAEALKEALQALRGAGSFGRTAAEKHAALEQYCLCRDAILALITEKQP